jgi:xanthine dehydrogenase YagT iron-sulfur-binding subunit
MHFSISLTVNGVQQSVELEDPRVTLLDLLRERLGLTGAKKGCDRGQCGACTDATRPAT